jgi:dTDP-glucose 4,6-dehydratase
MMIKTAVVTGFAGFIGTTFTNRLLAEGWKVYGIDKFTHVCNQSLLNIKNNNFEWEAADIKKIKWLPECDVIFNFAAESDVDIGNQSCDRFVKSNIDGVRNLLDIINNRIVLRADKPLFFQVSTDEVYGDLKEGIFDETAELKPSNPYAATKAAADLLIQAYARTYGTEYIIARPSNNYGYFQYPEKLIPLAVKRLSRGKKIKLHNEGKPIRSWTHSEDTASAILTLYEKAERNRVYNISSEFEQSNLDTVTKVINAYFLGKINRSIPDIEKHLDLSFSRPGQDVRYAISCEPLRELQWRPLKNFDTEIVSVVENYKKEYRW